MHFTPTSSSGLNLGERYVRDLTDRLTAASFASVKELAETIIASLAARDQNPKRYIWKAKGEDILCESFNRPGRRCSRSRRLECIVI